MHEARGERARKEEVGAALREVQAAAAGAAAVLPLAVVAKAWIGHA
jgi:hypothetical protein